MRISSLKYILCAICLTNLQMAYGQNESDLQNTAPAPIKKKNRSSQTSIMNPLPIDGQFKIMSSLLGMTTNFTALQETSYMSQTVYADTESEGQSLSFNMMADYSANDNVSFGAGFQLQNSESKTEYKSSALSGESSTKTSGTFIPQMELVLATDPGSVRTYGGLSLELPYTETSRSTNQTSLSIETESSSRTRYNPSFTPRMGLLFSTPDVFVDTELAYEIAGSQTTEDDDTTGESVTRGGNTLQAGVGIELKKANRLFFRFTLVQPEKSTKENNDGTETTTNGRSTYSLTSGVVLYANPQFKLVPVVSYHYAPAHDYGKNYLDSQNVWVAGVGTKFNF